MSRRKTERRYPLDRPPDGMVVEPDLPTNNPMSPSQLSQNNAMAESDEDYLPPVTDADGNPLPLDDLGPGMTDTAMPEVRRAAANIPETGVLFNLEPFEQIARLHAAGRTDEARKIYDSLDEQSRYVYNNARNMERFTAQEGARLADEFRRNQDRAAAQAADPVRQQAVAEKQVEVAEKQREVQQQYLQEMQYQRHIATLNDPNATRAERASAINAIDGLATAIGQRMVKGTAGTITADAKRAAGTVSSRIPLLGVNAAEYNPLNLVTGKNADYSAQLGTMLQGSQERMGVIRQQMETAGIPMPEAQQVEEAVKNPPAPSMFELSVQRLGVKGADGSQVTLGGDPVIRRKDGKLFKAMPNGKGVELTAEEISQLGL